uniref:Uncharacterized protein n=1 Tax=Arundo donax TaxID=35708 RepID=A0A0A9BBS7_ARUDO
MMPSSSCSFLQRYPRSNTSARALAAQYPQLRCCCAHARSAAAPT